MSVLSLVPVLTLVLRESTFVLIALAQGALVFFLCHASKSRVASIAIGAVGLVLALMVGDNRYGWLDALFVIVATLVAVGSLTPKNEGEPQGEVDASGQTVVWGLFILAIAVGGWYLLSVQTKPYPVGTAHLSKKSHRGEYAASRSHSSGGGSSSVAVLPAGSRPEKLEREKQRAAGSEGRRGGDLRRCLDLKDNAAIARCVGG